METTAILNPVAGSGIVDTLWPIVESRLMRAPGNLSVLRTSRPTEATRLTRSALQSGAERIVSVGGDGTLHEVVNGFFDEDGTPVSRSATLTPIPCGTGTDFRRSLDIPYGKGALNLVGQDRCTTIDLLRVEYRDPSNGPQSCYVVNVASFGISSHVADIVNRHHKSWFPGRVRYFGAILRALASHRVVPVAITVDDIPIPIRAVHLVAIANGHTFGGGLKIAPSARVNDGQLSVTIVDDTPIVSLLRHLPAFYRGTHPSLDSVTTRHGKTITVHPRTDTPVWFEADGEVLGHLPLSVEIVPDALRIRY